MEPEYEVIIVGAGFGGIGAGIALRKAGVHNFLIVDKWHTVGGTWLANTYPGVAVDIPSFIYSFSFEQRASWSRLFAPGEELQRYAEDVVDKYGLRSRLRLSTTLTGGTWDEDEHLWRVAADTGEELTARFVIGAVGGLEQPKWPDIEGFDSFTGKRMHTARWEHDYSLRGKRVAVIGTGATALQLIPAIADEVEHLTVFQRTPIWVAPKVDFAAGLLTKTVLGVKPIRESLRVAGNIGVEAGLSGALLLGPRAWPAIRVAEAGLKAWMRTQVSDPVLRDQLTPKYMLGCKRPSMSNTYLKTFTRDDVDLVVDPIARLTPDAVVTEDGSRHAIDVLICATGFNVLERGATPVFPIVGRDGLELGEFWHEHRFQAYHGVSVPRFPNLFFITGPYGFAPGSYFWLVEATAAHAARAIAEARRREATSIEVRQEPHDAYYARCLERAKQLPLQTASCAGSNTYYVDYHGDVAPLRPSTHAEMYWDNRHFPLDDYRYAVLSRDREAVAA